MAFPIANGITVWQRLPNGLHVPVRTLDLDAFRGEVPWDHFHVDITGQIQCLNVAPSGESERTPQVSIPLHLMNRGTGGKPGLTERVSQWNVTVAFATLQGNDSEGMAAPGDGVVG